MKLSELKAAVATDEEGVVVPIEGKDGEAYTADDGSPCTMTVVGMESKRLRSVGDRQTRRVLRNQVTKPTPEMLRSDRVEKAAAAVIAWHGWEDDHGADIPCSPENVAALLDEADHVLEQVEAAVRRHASFTKPPSANS